MLSFMALTRPLTYTCRWSWRAWWLLASPSSLRIRASLFFRVMKREDCTTSTSNFSSGSSNSRRPTNQPGDRPFRLCTSRPNSENYYLVAYDISNQEMRHYRVDKMAEIVVTGLPREGEDRYPDFDVAAYGQKHFGMYSGEEASVTLRCRSHMAGVVWDRFGQDVILVPEDEDHFTVTLPLVLSPQFFGWLFGLEDNVELIAPQKAAEEYRRKLKAVLEQYG